MAVQCRAGSELERERERVAAGGGGKPVPTDLWRGPELAASVGQ